MEEPDLGLFGPAGQADRPLPVEPDRPEIHVALIDLGRGVEGADPAEIVAQKGLRQVSDEGELRAIVQKVLDESPAQVEQYRSGKTKVLGYFVGQVMKATSGQANPRLVNELVRKMLD